MAKKTQRDSKTGQLRLFVSVDGGKKGAAKTTVAADAYRSAEFYKVRDKLIESLRKK